MTSRKNKLLKLLKENYGYDNYKNEQYDIINLILNKKNVCAMLPTGYGKSICFQIPALYRDKMCLVIMPILALMNDQQINLEKKGIKCCCYNSEINFKEKQKLENDILNNYYKIVFTTPESFKNKFFSKIEQKQISLIAIDEAHCITSYGFDFRPQYRDLVKLKSQFPKVPILALTGSATTNTLNDICKNLFLDQEYKIIKTSLDRKNLNINVDFKNDNTLEKILMMIKENTDIAIIYCTTIKDTEMICKYLQKHNIACNFYHGKMNSEDKKKVHNDFINENIKCVVATIAFGMGIDKSNVNLIIHYGMSKNLENYYQEIGRAGRNNNDSKCVMFWNNKDIFIQKNLDKNNVNNIEPIINYVQTNTCRRKILLNYFEENYDKSNCMNCDICINKEKAKDNAKSKLKKKNLKDVSEDCVKLMYQINDKQKIKGKYNEDLLDILVKKGLILKSKTMKLTMKGFTWIQDYELFNMELKDNFDNIMI